MQGRGRIGIGAGLQNQKSCEFESRRPCQSINTHNYAVYMIYLVPKHFLKKLGLAREIGLQDRSAQRSSRRDPTGRLVCIECTIESY